MKNENITTKIKNMDISLESVEFQKPSLRENITHNLADFLRMMDFSYQEAISKIDLFNIHKTALWNTKQKQYFAQLFYHARGHFYKFLWCIGIMSSEINIKNKVLENISEEFGEEKKSHEKLYFDFALSLGVNLEKEIYEEKFYLPFLREFDKNHIRWIVEHDSDSERLGLFSAYERLDNIDYSNLLQLVKSIGVSNPSALKFFIVHSSAGHFERLNSHLNELWKNNQMDIISAFEFIYSNQLQMWSALSNAVFCM